MSEESQQSSSSSSDEEVVPVATTTAPPSSPEHDTSAAAPVEPPQRTPGTAAADTTPTGFNLFWTDFSESSSEIFPPTPTDSIRTRVSDRRRPPPVMMLSCQRRFRSLVRCVCFPLMVLMTLVALLLFLLLIGLPFFLFLAGLLSVYYCCTTDPIPFRTLLRAMVGVEDWNGGAFDGTTTGGEPYHVTKEDIRKGIIRRLCLGPMEWKSTVGVGGDLSTLPRDHPGRVHWRNEGTSITCLVFSEPLGALGVEPQAENGETTGPTAEEMMQREESLRVSVPKYLQTNPAEEETKEEEEEKEGDEKVEEIEEETIVDKVEEIIPETNAAEAVEPVEEAEQASQPPLTDEEAPATTDDGSSVRDRGTVCDICLLEFETGEAVAWSLNPQCNHAYHEDCITDWLLRKPTCPSCRQNFIFLPTIRQVNDNRSSGVLDDDESDELESGERSGDDDRENRTSGSGTETNNWDGLQPPTATNTDGDIELGATTGNTSQATA